MIIHYNIEENHISINQYLLQKHYSKKLISALKYQGGEILVHNEPKLVDYLLKKGDLLTIILPKEEVNENILRTKMTLDLIYEDEYILIVNKQAGIPSIPSKRHFENTLANGIMNYYDENKIESNIHMVNRLDKDTSGLIMLAKNRHVHHLFDHFVTIEKRYLALVSGQITKDFVIEENIKRESEGDIKRMVASDGDYAKTGVKFIKQYDHYSLVELTLYTGRTHQIRVHMSYRHHPLLGDVLYGGSKDLIHRQALHSYYLKFSHPITHKMIEIIKEPPQDMLCLMI